MANDRHLCWVGNVKEKGVIIQMMERSEGKPQIDILSQKEQFIQWHSSFDKKDGW